MSKLQESILLINLLSASTPEQLEPHLKRLAQLPENSQVDVLRALQMKLVVQARLSLSTFSEEKAKELEEMLPSLEILQPRRPAPTTTLDAMLDTLMSRPAFFHSEADEKALQAVDKAQTQARLIDYIYDVLKEKTHPLLQETIAIRKTLSPEEQNTYAGQVKMAIALYKKVAEKPSLQSIIAKKHTR